MKTWTELEEQLKKMAEELGMASTSVDSTIHTLAGEEERRVPGDASLHFALREGKLELSVCGLVRRDEARMLRDLLSEML